MGYRNWATAQWVWVDVRYDGGILKVLPALSAEEPHRYISVESMSSGGSQP